MLFVYHVWLRALCRIMLILVCATSSLMACEDNVSVSTVEISFEGRSFAFYALSQGKGVPETTWQLLEALRVQFADMQTKGEIVTLRDERIGLEGETRLCAKFATEAIAKSTWEQITEGVKNGELELVNLKVEPCQEH